MRDIISWGLLIFSAALFGICIGLGITTKFAPFFILSLCCVLNCVILSRHIADGRR